MARMPNLASCCAARRESGHAADLDADGTEVGEAAEREGGDGKVRGSKRALHKRQVAKAQVIYDHTRPSRLPIFAARARARDEPRNVRRSSRRQFAGFPEQAHVRPVVNAAHHGVEERQ